MCQIRTSVAGVHWKGRHSGALSLLFASHTKGNYNLRSYLSLSGDEPHRPSLMGTLIDNHRETRTPHWGGCPGHFTGHACSAGTPRPDDPHAVLTLHTKLL